MPHNSLCALLFITLFRCTFRHDRTIIMRACQFATPHCSSTVTYTGVVFQQHTASVSLYNFHKLGLHADMSCVLCAVRTASLYIMQISSASNGITEKKNQELGRNQEASLYVAD